MRLDRGKRKLDVDIKNMFNEACRVAAGEDLVNSEQLIGEDLSDLLPYYEMAYMQEHGSWFWLAEKAAEEEEGEEQADRGGGEGRWVWIAAEDGFRQGSPLSCMLAALAGVKCVKAAQKAALHMVRYSANARDVHLAWHKTRGSIESAGSGRQRQKRERLC
jgi:hypothetical protein